MRLYGAGTNQQWRIVFLMLSRLKIKFILFYFWIGLDVVRSTGNLSSLYKHLEGLGKPTCGQ